jgi:hypothetical protein
MVIPFLICPTENTVLIFQVGKARSIILDNVGFGLFVLSYLKNAFLSQDLVVFVYLFPSHSSSSNNAATGCPV